MALDLKSEEGKIMFSYSYHIPPQEQLSYFQRMVERLNATAILLSAAPAQDLSGSV